MKYSETTQATAKFVGIEIPEGLAKRNFYFLYSASFLISMLMVFPAVIQPVFLKEIIGIPDKNAGAINSLLQNMSQIATLFLAGVVGFLSDRFGRRYMLLRGVIFTGLFFILFGYSKEIGIALGIPPQYAIYPLRFLLGVGLIFTWPHLTPLVADYTFKSSRGKAMAAYGLSMGIGAILAFGILGQLPQLLGIYESFYAVAIVAFTAALVAKRGIVDRIPEEKKKEKGKFRELFSLLSKSPSLKASYVATFVGRADTPILRLLTMVWLVTVAESHGVTPVKATGFGGLIMMVFALMSMLSNLITGPLVDKIGRMATLMISMLSSTIGFTILFTFHNPFSWLICLPIGLIGFGMSGVVIGANTLAADAAPRHLVGTVIGGVNTVQSVGIIILLQSAGMIRDILSVQTAFIFKAVINAFTLLWFIVIKKKCDDELGLKKPVESSLSAKA
ncbi:MAG: MFS transporter [Candidatus Schekmanbacteria bacterium]|nr:MAG: MFS transporter [Candidatus Schekmanbacteria bacterium]